MGVRSINTFNVRIYLANRCAKAGCQGNRCGVRTAAAQRRSVPPAGHSLESCNNGDVSLFQLVHHPFGVYAQNPGLTVARIRVDACLRAGETDCTISQGLQSHSQKSTGDYLPGRQEDIEFPIARPFVHLEGELNQVIGRMSHGGNNDDYLVSFLFRFGDTPGDVLNLLRVRHRATAVFLHYQRHIRPRSPISAGIISCPRSMTMPVLAASASVNLLALFRPVAPNPGPQSTNGTGSAT